jgi:hypothetical protein
MKSSPTWSTSSTLRATQQVALRFFDIDAVIRSDSSAYINLFARMYRRFRARGAPALSQKPVEFTVLTQPDTSWDQPVMILDGEIRPLSDPRLLEGYTYDGVLNTIVAGVRSHFLIHAGVVSCGGEGVILAADAGHGKTTLVLELVRRGFKFLSDEMAALGRADGRVHPFPRSLRVRPGTLEMTGFPEAAARAPEWLGKLLLDIKEIQPGSLGEPAAIHHIVILQDPAAPEGQHLDDLEPELGVLVDRLDEPLLAAVRQIEGVTEVRPAVERGYPTLRVRAAHRMSVLAQIETLCQEQQVLVLDVSKRPETQPAFDRPARLEAIPNSQAVMELLRRFQGGHKSALLQEEFGGSSARLFLELATLVRQANCYQLFVGPLSEVADLVCGLVNRPNA